MLSRWHVPDPACLTVVNEENDVIDAVTAPYGVLLLRWCLGAMFVGHALYKWRVDTIPGTVAFFKSLGLPGLFAYVTIATELGGAAGLVLGIYPRYVALLLMPLMIGTIVTVHGKNGWRFTNKGGGWEYPAFWTAALLAVFLMGDGALTLIASPTLAGVL
jgi:putative oxidoreductase